MDTKATGALSPKSSSRREISFRGFAGEADLPLVLRLVRESDAADGKSEQASVEEIADFCAPSARFDPRRDLVIALVDEASEGPKAVGLSKLGWYSDFAGSRLFWQVSLLTKEGRTLGLWPLILRDNERRLRALSSGEPSSGQSFYQAWSNDAERDWIATLESEGYEVVRQFHNMRHPLTAIAEMALPEGLEIRPVVEGDFRRVWEAQKALNESVFENVAEQWAEERYPAWAQAASGNAGLWQVAWAGEELAGMVLARFGAEEEAQAGSKRGFTEHIYVAPKWRKRGLAGALTTRALRALKALGALEAELGVDAANESAAYRLYGKLGYKTVSVDTWYRKAVPGDEAPPAGT